jgi:hypothetical protein
MTIFIDIISSMTTVMSATVIVQMMLDDGAGAAVSINADGSARIRMMNVQITGLHLNGTVTIRADGQAYPMGDLTWGGRVDWSPWLRDQAFEAARDLLASAQEASERCVQSYAAASMAARTAAQS